MADFFNLLKIDLLGLFGINKALKSKERNAKGKLIGVLALILLLGIMAIGYATGYSFLLATSYSAQGLPLDVIPEQMYSIGSIVVLIFAIFGANGMLFGMKDYESLISLPIKPRVIVLSKLAMTYIVDALLMTLIILPGGIICGIYDGKDLLYYIRLIVSLPFAPLMVMAIGLALGTVISYIGSRFKRSGIMNSIIAIAFLAAYFYFIFGIGNNAEDDEDIINMVSSIMKYFPLGGVFSRGVYHGKIPEFFGLILGSLAIGVVFTLVFGKMFKSINNAMTARATNSKYKLKSVKNESVFGALLKKEFKRLISSTNYLMNSSMGAVMFIIVAVLIGLNSKPFFSEFGSDVKQYIYAFAPLISIPFIGMTLITASAISIEGKNMWIIKSSPVNPKEWYLAKLALNAIINGVSMIISTIILAVLIGYDLGTVFFALIIGIAYTLVSSEFGLLMNIRFPSFEWKNEIQVVKQGASMTISMFTQMSAIIPIGGIQIAFFFMSMAINPMLVYLGFACISILLFALAFILYYVIMHYGVKKYSKF